MIVWLVGLSGAGKTTIGTELWRQWKLLDPATLLIDGDEIRRIFGSSSDLTAYTTEGRRQNANRIVELCMWVDQQSLNAVVNILCIFPEILEKNRTLFSSYFEVFIDAPIEHLKKRDHKGLYSAQEQKRGHVVGIDIPFPIPNSPDLTIKNDGPTLSPIDSATDILQQLRMIKQHGR